jgi:hypothetical protein
MNDPIKVYDPVWVMHNNRPVQMLVYAAVEQMDFGKTGTELIYHLTPERCGAGSPGREYPRFSKKECFSTKEELLESLK